jgi:hypothetical protein
MLAHSIVVVVLAAIAALADPYMALVGCSGSMLAVRALLGALAYYLVAVAAQRSC